MTYTIKGIRETGTITYHCATTRSALDKVQDFHHAEYSDITISAHDERTSPTTRVITLLDLESIGSVQV